MSSSMPEYTRPKAGYIFLCAAIIITISAVRAVVLLAGTSEPPKNTTKVTAVPGTLILLRPRADGVNYSATLNAPGHVIKDQDIENYLGNKAAEYDQSINGYGVNETGYLTILLETSYSSEEPEKTLAAIDKITTAKKTPLLPVQFLIPELKYDIEIADELRHNATVTKERQAEILRNITAAA